MNQGKSCHFGNFSYLAGIMTVTPPIIGLIAKRFRDPSKPKINQTQMAEHMGYGKAWASKLMSGKIQNLTDDQVAKLEEFLGIKLGSYFRETGEPVPALAVELGRKMKDSEALTKLVAAILELQKPQEAVTSPRWVDTQDMSKVGQEIIKIAFANEDKPGKVARLVLELLA